MFARLADALSTPLSSDGKKESLLLGTVKPDAPLTGQNLFTDLRWWVTCPARQVARPHSQLNVLGLASFRKFTQTLQKIVLHAQTQFLRTNSINDRVQTEAESARVGVRTRNHVMTTATNAAKAMIASRVGEARLISDLCAPAAQHFLDGVTSLALVLP